jgi:hypothetical protein
MPGEVFKKAGGPCFSHLCGQDAGPIGDWEETETA